MGRLQKVIKNGMRKDVIKLAAQGMKAKAIANELNKSIRKKKEQLDWQSIRTFMQKDAKAKSEILREEKKLKEQSMKYTINAQKELFTKFEVMSKKFAELSGKRLTQLSDVERLALLPRYSRELAYLIHIQEKILGTIKDGDSTVINFNNVYVEYRTIVFDSIREILSPVDQHKLVSRIKEMIEESGDEELL